MSFRSDLLKGRGALITGGGTGIGRGLAHAFAAHGCHVAVIGRRAEIVEGAAQEMLAHGGQTLGMAADVRDAVAVRNAVDATVAAFGRLDIVVNAAAGNFLCYADQMSSNGFGSVIDIDLKGTFNVAREAFQYLRERGGAILNVSATVQLLGTVGQVHAAAAKSGVDALTRTLAVEWGPHGIRVNGVAPGPTSGTEGADRLFAGEAGERIRARTPLRRLATIDDIASAGLFLCSDAARFITGVTLVVDGALWLHSSRGLADPIVEERSTPGL